MPAGTGNMVMEPVEVKQSGCVSKPTTGSAGNSFIVRITGVRVKEGQVPLKASAKYTMEIAVFMLGLGTMVPALGASYQITVCGNGTVATAVMVCNGVCSHWKISPPETGGAGAIFIVRVTAVLVSELHVPTVDSA